MRFTVANLVLYKLDIQKDFADEKTRYSRS